MTGPLFDQVNLVVRDMERSVDFYRLLGADVPDLDEEWRDWQGHHRSVSHPDGLDLDLDSEAYARRWNEGFNGESIAPKVVIGFRVASREEVDATYSRMTRAGYGSQQEPYDAPWGSRYAVVEDPDGNPVGLMSPRSDEFRSDQEPPG